MATEVATTLLFNQHGLCALRSSRSPRTRSPVTHPAGVGFVDPNLPVLAIRTMQQQVGSQFIQPRQIARLSSLFGILSLVLASVGLYGVIALVLRGAVLLTAAGLLIGLPLTLMAGRFLGDQLYGLSAYNPVV